MLEPDLSKQVSIIMYHFVRELPYTRYPRIKARLASEFREQLDYIRKYYKIVTISDCIEAVYSDVNLPKNAALLTFDDGYIDHYATVFPLLEERGIQGCFFPPAKAILDNEVLDVNKIHFVLATVTNLDALLKEIYRCLDEHREKYDLRPNDYYFSKLARANRFDCKEVIFVKRLLQNELDLEVRRLILHKLFKKYVTADEGAFSRELYMSSDQIRCMVRNGMYVGGHGYEHLWLDSLSPEQQEREIDLNLDFLKEIGSPLDCWVMCYPCGVYDDSLIRIQKEKGCKLALTVKNNMANLTLGNAFTLERLDTNDLPCKADAEPNEWTQRVLN
jgi:peptidoglycan/xylan/chitin deacetylase (PgdA/CDA1 family)